MRYLHRSDLKNWNFGLYPRFDVQPSQALSLEPKSNFSRHFAIIYLLLFFYVSTIESATTLSLSGNPDSLSVNSITAGEPPVSATSSSRTYSVTTDGNILKIVGKISQTMPTGVTLSLNLSTAGIEANSAGSVPLSTTNKNLVTNIPRYTTGSSLMMTYTLAATIEAEPVTGSRVTVTLTLQ